MKSGDIIAVMNSKKFQEARAAHKAWNDEFFLDGKKITVDTAFVVDCGCYETGIKNIYWHIVERYIDEKDAKKGHNKWVKWVKTNPDKEIPDPLGDAY